jgi:hypothetical protein
MQYAHGNVLFSRLLWQKGEGCNRLTFFTGISTHGTPFSPPVAFRRIDRTAQAADDALATRKGGKPVAKSQKSVGKNEKSTIEQGRCHRCGKWVNVEGVKDVEVKVRASV